MPGRQIQIGVMGSAADLKYDSRLEEIALDIGYEIAQRGATLIFGAEKDCDSLSTAACRGAKKGGGMTIGITYGKGLDIYEKINADVVIASGLERGGGRETALVLSCDGIICISGGSGTLTEVAIAYQAGIPVVAIKDSGGWADKLINTYIDKRERILVEPALDAKGAVDKILDLISKTASQI